MLTVDIALITVLFSYFFGLPVWPGFFLWLAILLVVTVKAACKKVKLTSPTLNDQPLVRSTFDEPLKRVHLLALFEDVLSDRVLVESKVRSVLKWIEINSFLLLDTKIRAINNHLLNSLTVGLERPVAFEAKLAISEFCDDEISKTKPLPMSKKKLTKFGSQCKVDEYLIHYKDEHGQISAREIHVNSVVRQNGFTYLNALCRKRKVMRIFRLDRVIDAVDLSTGEILTNLDAVFR